MKLNRKGYMLVEIILASVIAMGIAIYLLNLTYKFKNTNDELQRSITYNNDKNVVVKNIMNDLVNLSINVSSIKVDRDPSFERISFSAVDKSGNTVYRKIYISERTIQYGGMGSLTGAYNRNDYTYYTKTLKKTMVIGSCSVSSSTYSTKFIIPVDNMYDDNDYDINLIILNK